MISLNSKEHKDHCQSLIERACNNKLDLQKETIRVFHHKLLISLSAFAAVTEVVSTNRVLPSSSLLVRATNFALSFIPAIGPLTAQFFNTLAGEKIVIEAEALNALLGTPKTRRLLIERFCAEAIYYHHEQILHPGPTGMLATASHAMRTISTQLLTNNSLTLSENEHELLLDLIFTFTSALGDASQRPYDYPVDHPDKLMSLISEHLIAVNMDPLLNQLHPFDEITTDKRWPILFQALRLSKLAYEHESKIQELAKCWGYQLDNHTAYKFIQKNEISSIVLADQRQIFITFAGKNSFDNIVTHLNINMTSVNGLGYVHSGFENAYQGLKPALDDILRYHEKYTQSRPLIIMTGHSLGGALAVRAAADYIMQYPNGKDRVQVYTFAQPNIGKDIEPGIAQILNNRVHRFICPEDPLMHDFFSYDNLGHEYTLPVRSEIFDWNGPKKLKPSMECFLSAHSLSTYQSRIKDHAANELFPIKGTSTSTSQFISSEQTATEKTLVRSAAYQLIKESIENVPVKIETLSKVCEIPFDTLPLLEQHVWKEDFTHHSTEVQQAILDIFLRGLAQHFLSSRNDPGPFRTMIHNADAFLLRRLHIQSVACISEPSDLLLQLLGTMQQLRRYLAWNKYRAEHGQYQWSDISSLIVTNDEESLRTRQNKIFKSIKMLQETSFFMKHKSLADATIFNLLTDAMPFSSDSATAAQAYMYMQEKTNQTMPMEWHRAAIALLLRKAKNVDDLWATLIGECLTHTPEPVSNEFEDKPDEHPQHETMRLGLSHWLQMDTRLPENESYASLNLVKMLQTLKATHPHDALLERVCIAYEQGQAQNNATLLPFSHALYTAAKDPKLEDKVRLKAWQYYETLLSQKGRSPTAQDFIDMGACAADAEDFDVAIRYYKMAHGLMERSFSSDTYTKAIDDTKSILTELIYIHKIEKATSAWQKAKIYLEMAHFASAEHRVHKHIFESVLDVGLKSITKGLDELAIPISIVDENERRTLIERGAILIQDFFGQYWQLKKGMDYASNLFEGDHIRPTNKITNPSHNDIHNVAHVGSLHFKENPGCSGLAFSAWAFSACFFLDDNPRKMAPGFIPALPAKVFRRYKNVVQIIHVQVTPHAAGENLKNLLDSKNDALSEETENKLDLSEFSDIFILSLLLDLEDGRAPNWIINKKTLINIDNDHILIRELFKEGKLEIKNILFCLDEMDKPIHADTRAIVTDKLRSPLPRIRLWLKILECYTNQLHQTSTHHEIEELYNRANATEKVILEPFFHPQAMGRLFIKLFKLRAALRREADDKKYAYVTPQDLHAYLQPDVAKHYARVRKLHDYPLRRFTEIMPGTQTTSTSQIIDKILPPKKTGASYLPSFEYGDYKTFTANCATPSNLLALLPSFQNATNMVDIIVNEIKQGYLETFIEVPNAQPAVLLCIKPEIYQKMSLEFHQALLNAISREHTTITLKDNALLTDTTLVTLIQRMSKLTQLTLENCPLITGYTKGFFSESPWLIDFCQRGIKIIKLSTCEALDSRLLNLIPIASQTYGVEVEIKLLTLLRFVAEGAQDKVEEMIEAHPGLLLQRGNVVDLSGRTFKNITAFQYAVWALDWHMWEMILKHLKKIPDWITKLQTQSDQFETGDWVSVNGETSEKLIQNLIDELKQFICHDELSFTDRQQYWIKRVGGAQLQLPVHVVNEYCHPYRPLYPTPNFRELTLPRTRDIFNGENWMTSKIPYQGEWFTAIYKNGRLGEKWAAGRWDLAVCQCNWRANYELTSITLTSPVSLSIFSQTDFARKDQDAISMLLKVRTEQREKLLIFLNNLNSEFADIIHPEMQLQTATTRMRVDAYSMLVTSNSRASSNSTETSPSSFNQRRK